MHGNEAWVRAKALFGVDLRRPEMDETMLSDEEIMVGIRRGIFDGLDGDQQVFVLERPRAKEAVFA